MASWAREMTPEDADMTSRGGMQGRTRAAPIARRHAPAAPAVPSEDALLPVIAGARARGMADAFESLGVAAVMLDRAGMSLHASSHTARFVGIAAGKGLSMPANTLICANPVANRALQAAIAEIVGGEETGNRRIVDAESGVAMIVKPVPGAESDRYQLLKALIILETVV